ncbi:hypothetical protein ACFV29_12445 [Streptomyces sp. NPDC059690]|uniref:hypothetical protein n=1 Tax=Streptomyces sp. NPDC059690 TaxID=3346907 RepID=UPI0036BFF027
MASTTRRTSVGRAAAAGLAATASLALLGAVAPAATAAQSGAGARGGATAVVGKDTYGKWVKTGPTKVKCRIYVAVSAGSSANAAASSTCKETINQTVVAALTINNQKIKHTSVIGKGKNLYTKALKAGNPRGRQTICAIGWVNSAVDPYNPERSEATVCIKA